MPVIFIDWFGEIGIEMRDHKSGTRKNSNSR